MLCFFCCFLFVSFCFFCFKQKTAYEMRISDWSSDVCSSDLGARFPGRCARRGAAGGAGGGADRPRRARFAAARSRALSLWPRYRRNDDSGDRKSVVSGKSVYVRVDLGGGRIIKKKKKTITCEQLIQVETKGEKNEPDT